MKRGHARKTDRGLSKKDYSKKKGYAITGITVTQVLVGTVNGHTNIEWRKSVMTEVQHQLVQIIANQLFGADYPLTDTADWHEILDEAQHQTVFPVVFSYLMEYSPNFFNATDEVVPIAL